MKILIFVLALLLPAPAWAECALVALTGNGSDASPYRPNLPPGITKIPGASWSAQIPAKADGTPLYSDVYVCFADGFKFPPGLSALPPAEAAKGVLARDPKANLKAMTPPPAVIKGSWQDYRDRAYRLAEKYLGMAKAWAAFAIDNFNTGTSALSGSWSVGYGSEGTPTVISNAAECAIGSRCVAGYNALTTTGDMYAQGVITQYTPPGVSTDGDAGPAVRMGAPTAFDGYFARCGNFSGGTVSTLLQRRHSSGTNATVATEIASGAWAFGDTARIEIIGTAITVYRNGTPVASNPDSALTGGRGGMMLNSAFSTYSGDTARLDNFEVGDIGGGGGPASTRRRVVVVQ